MGTISNHRSCYNNTVHHYTTYDKTWEQYSNHNIRQIMGTISITTLCITTQHTSCYNKLLLCITTQHTTQSVTTRLHNIRHPMGTICYHRSCYNNTVHHYTTYDKTCEQSVTTRAAITILYITTQHTTNHGNNQ